MKKIYLVLLPFLLCRCSYDFIEDVRFNQNNTADIKISVDFAKSLESENKDMIVSMVTQSVEGFASKYTGSGNLSLDLPIQEMKDGSKPVNFELALDTATIIQRDSLLVTIHEKDSLNQLSDKQENEICDLLMYLTNHLIVRMKMDVNKKIMFFEFEFRNISYDSLDFYHFREFTSSKALMESNEKFALAGKLFPEWKANKVTRSENNYDIVQPYDGQEPDEVLRKAWENSDFIIRYHFPAPVKSCSNKLFQTSSDGKTLTFSQSLLDLYKNNPSTSVSVEY